MVGAPADCFCWPRPADGEGLFMRVYRWEEAVCLGPPGMVGAVAEARRQLRSEIPNLFRAGDYTRVPSVNAAVAQGVGAAEEYLLASRASRLRCCGSPLIDRWYGPPAER